MTAYTLTIAGHPLDIKAGSLTLDESWAPYIQARLVVPMPSATALADLDPREHPRALLLAGPRSFDLLLRERQLDYSTGELAVTLMSDEALLFDHALLGSAPLTFPGPGIRSVVTEVLARVGAELDPYEVDPAVTEPDALTWPPGRSGWDFLTPLLQATGMRLWCDEARVWRLDDARLVAAGLLDLDYSTNMIQPTDTISVTDDFYDAAVIEYRWDFLGTPTTSYDYAGDISNHRRALHLSYDQPYPGPGAAFRILSRAEARGQKLVVRTVTDWTATPKMPVRVLGIPDAGTLSAYLARVDYDLAAEEMTITTRGISSTPDTAWLFATPGVSWNDIPAGVSWQSYGWGRLRTNLVTNPNGAATPATSGYASFSLSTAAAGVTVTDLPNYSTGISFGMNAYGDYFYRTLPAHPSTAYYAAAWVKAPAGHAYELTARATTGALQPDSTVVSAIGNGAWQELGGVYVGPSAASHWLGVRLAATPAAAGLYVATGFTVSELDGPPMYTPSEYINS